MYDVIIIGAGPAGISAALELNKLGINNICIIDRAKFPRLKPCAGYLTTSTKDLLLDMDVDITNHNYQIIKGFKLFYKNKQRLHMDNKGLWSNHKIDREELDFALFNKAKEKNIIIKEKESVIKHDKDNNKVTTSKSTYSYKHLIFADGTSGFSSNYQNKHKKKNIALQITFPSNKKESVDIHFGITKKGYAWVSSTGKITNVGFTDVYKRKIDYVKVMEDFTKELGFKIDKTKIKSSFVPIRINKNIVMNNNIYFTGDSVGAADPITLAGVSYAILTGKYAALSIKNNNHKEYIKKVKKLGTKFLSMKLMMDIFYLKTTLFCLFSIGTNFFGEFISYTFDNLFANSKIDYKSIMKIITGYRKHKKQKQD